MRYSSGNHGFTLLEVVVYTGILSIFLATVGVVVNGIIANQADAAEREELIANEEFVGEKLAWLMGQTSQVIVPSPNSSSTNTLSLGTYATSTNPAVITFVSSTLFLSLAGAANVPLTSNRVAATAFLAEQVVPAGGPSLLRLSLSLESSLQKHASSTVYITRVIPE